MEVHRFDSSALVDCCAAARKRYSVAAVGIAAPVAAVVALAAGLAADFRLAVSIRARSALA